MPFHNGYTACIRVNGIALQEYDVPPDEDIAPRVHQTKYIEVPSEGANFEIDVHAAAYTNFPTAQKAIDFRIDGRGITGAFLQKFNRGPTTNGWRVTKSSVSFQTRGNYETRKLQFKPLVTTEVNGDPLAYKNFKEIGLIEITISDATIHGPLDNHDDTYREPASVPEKALKGQSLSMVIGLGPAEPSLPQSLVVTQRRIPYLARFHLKYRNKQCLQMLDIMATTPEPQALEERELDSLNLDEARKLLSRYRERGHNIIGFKREGSVPIKAEQARTVFERKRQFVDDDDCQIVEVKRVKSVVADEVEVLDLT